MSGVAGTPAGSPAVRPAPGCARRLQSRISAQRSLAAFSLLAVCVVAVASEANAPREYLDDQTGATVTFVGRPLVFAHERAGLAWSPGPQNAIGLAPQDYVTLAAAAVNRGGKYTYMLLGYFWFVGQSRPGEKACFGREHLVLELGDRRIELAPADGSARDAGIRQPIHRPALAGAEPTVYPTDLATLGLIAESVHPVLYCGAETAPLKYELIEDRLPALRELVRQLSGSN
jgi:hypothetical protein